MPGYKPDATIVSWQYACILDIQIAFSQSLIPWKTCMKLHLEFPIVKFQNVVSFPCRELMMQKSQGINVAL